MSAWKQTTKQTSNYIYHERQESNLCGQHCLNNLMQGPFFNAVELSNIALELDAKERALIGKSLEYNSANVDDSGNFSIQVLKTALAQQNVQLETWHQRSGEAGKDPSREKAFIVNRSSHWYTVRKLHSEWYNLNSSAELPEVISTFYMTAFFSGLKAEGYTIFVASGAGLVDKREPASVDYLPRIPTGTWYEERQLKSLIENGVGGGVGAAAGVNSEPEKKFNAFEGKARRLDGQEDQQSQAESLMAQLQGAENDEELQLALAISASLQQEAQKKEPTKDEIRAKRLAALEKRG